MYVQNELDALVVYVHKELEKLIVYVHNELNKLVENVLNEPKSKVNTTNYISQLQDNREEIGISVLDSKTSI